MAAAPSAYWVSVCVPRGVMEARGIPRSLLAVCVLGPLPSLQRPPDIWDQRAENDGGEWRERAVSGRSRSSSSSTRNRDQGACRLGLLPTLTPARGHLLAFYDKISSQSFVRGG